MASGNCKPVGERNHRPGLQTGSSVKIYSIGGGLQSSELSSGLRKQRGRSLAAALNTNPLQLFSLFCEAYFKSSPFLKINREKTNYLVEKWARTLY